MNTISFDTTDKAIVPVQTTVEPAEELEDQMNDWRDDLYDEDDDWQDDLYDEDDDWGFDSPSDEYDRYSRHLGNGYCGRSTSRNSLIAREMGAHPISEWSKSKIMDDLAEIDTTRMSLFKKISLPVLQAYCLRRTGYHHTSKWFNKTDFYELNEEAISSLSDETLVALASLKKPKSTVETTFGTFKYIEWEEVSGRYGRYTKPNHIEIPKAKIDAKGKFYSVWDETGKFRVSKKIGSTGTEVILDPLRIVPGQVTDFLGIEPCNYSQIEQCVPADLFEISRKGIIYPKGRKPTPDAFDNGLGNFFRIGEKRAGKNSFGDYRVEEWNGGWWLPAEAKTAA